MIGIYLITNNLNNKKYVGQSNNIERRLKEHCYPGRFRNGYPIDVAIHKYGKENFTFEILEECLLEELNSKEEYWINYFHSNGQNGYNCNPGGEQSSIGENNGNAILNENDIVSIRTDYMNHVSQAKSYERFENKITFSTFQGIWQGDAWPHIMPEVYTEENKSYYKRGGNAVDVFSEKEVTHYRTLYITQTADEIYSKIPSIQSKVTLNAFKKMLAGMTYKNYPFYSKKTKTWYYNGNRPAASLRRKQSKNQGAANGCALLNDEKVQKYRELYVTHTAKEVYELSQKELSFDPFRKMLEGKTYCYLPYYSKKNKTWIYPESVSTISGSGE